MVMRKWEYVARRCYEKGMDKTAKIAIEMDWLVRRLGYDDHTQSWLDFIQNHRAQLDQVDIVDLAYTPEYCTPCQACEHDCDACSFGKADCDSYFSRFVIAARGEEE